MLDGHFILLFIALNVIHLFIHSKNVLSMDRVCYSNNTRAKAAGERFVSLVSGKLRYKLLSFPFWGYIGILSCHWQAETWDTCVVAQGQGQGTGQFRYLLRISWFQKQPSSFCVLHMAEGQESSLGSPFKGTNPDH